LSPPPLIGVGLNPKQNLPRVFFLLTKGFRKAKICGFSVCSGRDDKEESIVSVSE
jgi:hypothetical protein